MAIYHNICTMKEEAVRLKTNSASDVIERTKDRFCMGSNRNTSAREICSRKWENQFYSFTRGVPISNIQGVS